MPFFKGFRRHFGPILPILPIGAGIFAAAAGSHCQPGRFDQQRFSISPGERGAACQPGGRVMPARRVSGSPGFPCRIASPRPVRRVSGFAAASGGSQPDRRFPSPPINSGKMPAASTAARKNRRGAPRPDRPKNQHPLFDGTLYVPPLQRGRLTSVYRKTFRRTYEGLRLSPSQALQIRACCRLTRSPPIYRREVNRLSDAPSALHVRGPVCLEDSDREGGAAFVSINAGDASAARPIASVGGSLK